MATKIFYIAQKEKQNAKWLKRVASAALAQFTQNINCKIIITAQAERHSKNRCYKILPIF
jgi:hypothetical protein